MPAEVEEAVVARDGIRTQQLAPQLRQLLFAAGPRQRPGCVTNSSRGAGGRAA